MDKTKTPIQARAVKTRNKIIRTAMKEFSENGYYKTTTPIIAKAAGVSTGVVYRYFEDKKDILMECITIYLNEYKESLRSIIKNATGSNDIKSCIRKIIELVHQYQTDMRLSHLELLAIPDAEIDLPFYLGRIERESVELLVEILNKNPAVNITTEKGLIVVWLIDKVVDEIIYIKHDEINNTVLIDEVVDTIYNKLIQ